MTTRTQAPLPARALFGAAAVAAAVTAVLAGGTGAPATTWIGVASALCHLGVGLLGLLLATREPRNPAAWVLLAASAGTSALTLVDLLTSHATTAVATATLGVLRSAATLTLFGLFTLGVLLFPDGRPAGRLGRAATAGTVLALGLLFVGGLDSPLSAEHARPVGGVVAGVADGLLLAGLALVVVLTVVAAVNVGTRRRGARGDARRALLLAEVAAWVNAAAFVVCGAVSAAGTLPAWFGAVADQTGVVLAVAAWVGIVRFGLVDLRAVASRTLPYLALSAVVVAAAALVAALVGSLVSGWLAAGLAAAVAALVALPLRDQLQEWANLLVYGRRADPGRTLALLGERLGEPAAPGVAVERALAALSEVFAVTARVVEGDDEPATGQRIPLRFAGRPLGALVVDGRLRPADAALVASLAPQLAAAVHARRLDDALRDSHRLLVAARDGERRRIHRDLHDGLGPTLAGMVLGVESAERHLDDPARARAELARLHQAGQDAVQEVRRLVYALRPPVLDSLGLDGAIREQASRLGAAFVETSELPELADSFETGVYLIALEAMRNAATHARPGDFWVRLVADERLALEIHDDGPGLPADHTPGVGLRAMRERAAELGGVLHILPRRPHGTLVHADWPLPA